MPHSPITGRHILGVALMLAAGVSESSAQRLDLASAATWPATNRTVTVVRSGDTTIARFDERPGAGVAISPVPGFQDGDIDVDTRGRDVLQKSFVGVVFHYANDSTFETVWLRPFNFRADDTTRHIHSVQFASYPTYSWQRLRADHPGQFESALVPPPNPDGWVHLRVEVRGAHVRAFVDGKKVLDVESPAPRKGGSVGLWVGDNSNGDFANLVIRKGVSGADATAKKS
jgi:hypothetical protein